MAINTFEQNVAQLGTDLESIKVALEDTHLVDMTGVKPEQYAQKIREIDEWVYPDEWRFDGKTVDEILDADTEDYPGKIIVLLDNSQNDIDTQLSGYSGYKTSDTKIFQAPKTQISFTGKGDVSIKDGRKIRWILLYFADNNANYPGLKCADSLIYITIGVQLISPLNSSSFFFTSAKKLQYINCKKGYVLPSINMGFIQELYSLKNIELTAFNNEKNLSRSSQFSNCPNVKTIDIYGEGEVNSVLFNGWFNSCFRLQKINCVINAARSTGNNMMIDCVSLRDVKIKNLGLAINLSSCYSLSRDSLIYLINNLQTITSGSQTLTLGALNICKLTTEELAIATTKGWVIA